MTAPRPAWWSPEAGFAGAPSWTALATGECVCVVGVAGQTERNAARQAIRQAVRAALPALFGVDAAAIGMHAVSGHAPYATVLADADGQVTGRRIALAFSHDEALSVAAIGREARVGIDLMRIVEIPDWQPLAHDYLGPHVAQALAALAPAQRPVALARAWSEREARLKCLGRPIGEWQADEDAALAACRCLPLDLPDGYVGVLATAPALLETTV